ncbi:hypothetical protein ANN_13459 [Periplaneta americana]|uniref:Uncharacterized protein n=1 Tax=Periplaneta americana TaxID=6978 RepID=A0ABQ8TM18_PERAM|nr:hypothetical protein ANN_13459 [Periplaneta americana]
MRWRAYARAAMNSEFSKSHLTDRLYTATYTHRPTLLSTDVHIRTDHVRYTLRYLHCFSVVSCPHPSDSAFIGILPRHRCRQEEMCVKTLKLRHDGLLNGCIDDESLTASTNNCYEGVSFSFDTMDMELEDEDVDVGIHALRFTWKQLATLTKQKNDHTIN